jgi:hypothetical protein
LRDEIRLGVSPERVSALRVSRRWKPQVIDKHAVQCSGSASSDWRPCVEALQQAVQELRSQKADATVVFSNHFVRYALVPWSEHLVSEEEKLAWVRHHFIELYGEPAVPVDYRWSEGPPDTPCVATAVDSELLAHIRAVLEPTSLRLRSLQPYLMAVFNRLRRQVRKNPVWIVIPETGRVCVAVISNGQWRTITSTGIGPDWHAELSLLIERRLLLSDETPAVVLAYGAEMEKLDLAHISDVPLRAFAPRALAGYSPLSDAEYSMALTGLV